MTTTADPMTDALSAPQLAPLTGRRVVALVEALGAARERTLALVAPLSEERLEATFSPLMSPLVWDLGHIAAFEDLWLVHRHGGRPLLRAELAELYDAAETPRSHRGRVPLPGARAAREYLDAVRARTREVIAERGVGDGLLHELVLRHELQHTETMLQAIELAQLEDYAPAARPQPVAERCASGLELVQVEAGSFEMGAPCEGFAYDNERPRHRLTLPSFRIGRAPVTNGDYLAFIAAGGYRRQEWWSAEGWAWRQASGAERPAGWSADGHEWRLGGFAALDPGRPVVHVSCFEAEAFARAHAARLPTESEWEKAAAWDPATQAARRYPWGPQPPSAARANLGQLAFGTEPAGARPAGASPGGCLDMLGQVWEWTASEFDGYPGFRAHPYREYSEVFFGRGYRVLRGGSWATAEQIATTTFRNWDLPQRRQIFAGFRIAKDGAA